MTREVIQGDISQAWPVGVKDKDKVQLPLAGFSCVLAVVHVDTGIVMFNRTVTQIENDRFIVYLMDTETSQLTVGDEYLLVVQVENLSLPKPIKREKRVSFQTIQGFIV